MGIIIVCIIFYLIYSILNNAYQQDKADEIYIKQQMRNRIGNQSYGIITREDFLKERAKFNGFNPLNREYLNTLKTDCLNSAIKKKLKASFCINNTNVHNTSVLKDAFYNIGLSEYLDGYVDLKNILISDGLLQSDLYCCSFANKPFGISFSNYRFYFFEDNIIAFHSNDKLAGVYDKKAINCNFTYQKQYLYNNQEYRVYKDSKTEGTFTSTQWQHQKLDGGPDMRYKYNKVLHNTGDPMYLYQCQITIEICGASCIYNVSSYDNSSALNDAIKQYRA